MPSQLTHSPKDEPRGLQRSLTHGQMTMIVLGSALGTGLFLGSGAVSYTHLTLPTSDLV